MGWNMRHGFLVFLSAWVVAGVLSSWPAGAGEWYLDTDVMAAIRRGGNAPAVIGHVDSGPFGPGEVVLSTNRSIDRGLGVQLTAGYRWDNRQSIEVSGIGIMNSGKASAINVDPGGQDLNAVFCNPFLFAVCPVGGVAGFPEFDQAARIRLEYDATLIGGEVGYRTRADKHWSWLAGFRYLFLGERLKLVADDGGGVGGPFTDTAVYKIRTRNHLFGPQIGVNAAYRFRQRYRLSFAGKGALLINRASTHSQVYDDDGNTVRTSNTRHRVAGLLQGRLLLEWTPTKHLTLSAGYGVLFIPGVSTAPNQLARGGSVSEFKKHVSGHALYHGPILRLVLKFQTPGG